MSDEDIKCKICYSFDNPVSKKNDLISPCKCKGSLKYVHAGCLKMWRYSRKYSDIKRCLQCGINYNLKDEISPNNIALFFLTVLILLLVYFVVVLVMSLLISSSFYLVAEFVFDDIFFTEDQIRSVLSISQHYSSLFIYIFVYKVIFYHNFFAIFNFVFTYWRILQFNFLIDKILFWGMCMYYGKQMYRTLYNRLDRYIIKYGKQ